MRAATILVSPEFPASPLRDRSPRLTCAAWASALLDSVAESKIPRGDLSAFHVRQIRSLDNAARELTPETGG